MVRCVFRRICIEEYNTKYRYDYTTTKGIRLFAFLMLGRLFWSIILGDLSQMWETTATREEGLIVNKILRRKFHDISGESATMRNIIIVIVTWAFGYDKFMWCMGEGCGMSYNVRNIIVIVTSVHGMMSSWWHMEEGPARWGKKFFFFFSSPLCFRWSVIWWSWLFCCLWWWERWTEHEDTKQLVYLGVRTNVNGTCPFPGACALFFLAGPGERWASCTRSVDVWPETRDRKREARYRNIFWTAYVVGLSFVR